MSKNVLSSSLKLSVSLISWLAVYRMKFFWWYQSVKKTSCFIQPGCWIMKSLLNYDSRGSSPLRLMDYYSLNTRQEGFHLHPLLGNIHLKSGKVDFAICYLLFVDENSTKCQNVTPKNDHFVTKICSCPRSSEWNIETNPLSLSFHFHFYFDTSDLLKLTFGCS